MTADAPPPEPAGPRSSRGRGRPSTLDRTRALDAAWRVIADRGLDRARYVDIARESGTPVSTLQNAFGTLDALLNETIEHASTHVDDVLATIPSADNASASDRLQAFIDVTMSDASGPSSWLVWLELLRAAARDTPLAHHTSKAYRRWWQAAESIIADGQRSGEFATDHPAKELAVAILAVIDGCAFARLIPAGEGPDAATTQAVARTSVFKLLRP